MSAELSGLAGERRALWRDITVASDTDVLCRFAIIAGVVSSILFVAIGLSYQLQMYGDGSMFSYSVAAQDVWAFHWHNISGRLFVHLYAMLPAEAYVGLTGDAHGGIAVYGLLFFVAQLAGLGATYAADRSEGRIIFAYACFSTACLCPLVFGCPTEMWLAHCLFWPALAICHYARSGLAGAAAVFSVLLALSFTHAGGLLSAFAILASFALRQDRRAALMRAGVALLAIVSICGVVCIAYPPDAYFAGMFVRAAKKVFNVGILTGDLMLLLSGAIAGYGAALLACRRLAPANAHVHAASIVAAALAAYWLWFDHSLHAENRYYLRTVLLTATPALGMMAAAYAFDADGRLAWRVPLLTRLVTALKSAAAVRAVSGAFALVLLIHAVETAKFVTAWTNYEAAVRTLATGTASDPKLGHARFVSSARIDAGLNRLSWFSTTQYLSVLLAPKLAPARLVVDPDANYFWLSCRTATDNLRAQRVVPVETRALVRVHACLHR